MRKKYWFPVGLITVLGLTVLVWLSIPHFAFAQKGSGPQRISKITQVRISIEKSDPPNLLVYATGEVNLEGCYSTSLLRRIYKIPPQDGIWEYDLISLPLCTKEATDKPGQVEGADRWTAYEKEKVKGVRVYGEDGGIIEKLLPSK